MYKNDNGCANMVTYHANMGKVHYFANKYVKPFILWCKFYSLSKWKVSL